MACDTCGHTMQSVGTLDHGDGCFWCPRCGTLRNCRQPEDEDAVPKLVERCRTFRDTLAEWPDKVDPAVMNWLVSLGIAESINPPEGRSTHPDRGAAVTVTCPKCNTPIRLPADPVDHNADRHCPVCNADLPYLPEASPR